MKTSKKSSFEKNNTFSPLKIQNPTRQWFWSRLKFKKYGKYSKKILRKSMPRYANVIVYSQRYQQKTMILSGVGLKKWVLGFSRVPV
jgi:hypothetical protein